MTREREGKGELASENTLFWGIMRILGGSGKATGQSYPFGCYKGPHQRDRRRHGRGSNAGQKEEQGALMLRARPHSFLP